MTKRKVPFALAMVALCSVLALGLLAACSSSSSSGGNSTANTTSTSTSSKDSASSGSNATSSNSQSSASNSSAIKGNVNVLSEYLGEWKTAVVVVDTEEDLAYAPEEDYTLTISKDGVVRVSTGEVYLLKYPTDANGKPDPSSYDYYFVGEGLPPGQSDIMFDIYGEDKSELWECHFLENGHDWTIILTRDGEPPAGMEEDLEER